MNNRKPTCAVISTWETECGIAGFAHKMVPALEEYFDVKVFSLDQSILKPIEGKLIKLGDKHIDDICSQIKKFDIVNIQFEPGILGSVPKIIFNRLYRILDSAQKYWLTFHTVRQDSGFRKRTFINKALRKSPLIAIDYWHDTRLTYEYGKLYQKLTKKYRYGFCLYHTKSAKKFINLRYPSISTIDHPLVFISKKEKSAYSSSIKEDNQWIKDKYNIDNEKIIISCYGFISKYKNFETPIEAIYRLPDNFHLMIFGATHPNEITPLNTFNKYLDELINLIDRKSKNIPEVVNELLESNRQLTIDLSAVLANSNYGHSSQGHLFESKEDKNKSKVSFGGSLNDKDFERAINGSDINVFSYLEVGQTSSGPISISLDLSKKSISTYNKCFNQLSRYAEDAFEQYDIGNYQQLASNIKIMTTQHRYLGALHSYNEKYNTETRAKLIYDTMTNLK